MIPDLTVLLPLRARGMRVRRCGVLSPMISALLAMLVLVGCEQSDGIVTYRVPTKIPEQLLPGKERLLAVMIPRGEKVWFFKLMGPKDAIDLVDAPFRDFVAGIAFDDRDEPILDELPEGWRRGGKKAMRFATIDVNTPAKQLDLSISNLSVPGELNDAKWDAYVVSNVDRWRGQVGLSPSKEKWAGAESIDVAAAKGKAVWVDVVGQPGKGGPTMTSGGSMAGAAPFMPPAASSNPGGGKNRSVRSSPLDYEVPEGWQEGKAGGMREAEFRVGPPDASAEITIIEAGGDLRSNVARWMGQVAEGSPEESAVDEMMASAEKFEVSGRAAQRFVISGDADQEQESIDATIVKMDNGMSKFIKMKGAAATVAEQSDSMRTFLDSLTF